MVNTDITPPPHVEPSIEPGHWLTDLDTLKQMRAEQKKIINDGKFLEHLRKTANARKST
jgi:hypothetical protein